MSVLDQCKAEQKLSSQLVALMQWGSLFSACSERYENRHSGEAVLSGARLAEVEKWYPSVLEFKQNCKQWEQWDFTKYSSEILQYIDQLNQHVDQQSVAFH